MSDERHAGEAQCIERLDPWTVNVKTVGTWKFDGVFAPGMDRTSEEVFDSFKDIVHDAFDGCHGSIFTYGQAGAGKTHTLFGADGIWPRMMCREIFNTEELQQRRVNTTILCSAIEMVGSELVDSLNKASRGASTKLNVREDRNGSILIEHLIQEQVSTVDEMLDASERGRSQLKMLDMGSSQRSASHFIFLITVHTVHRDTKERLKGTIKLFDLASPVRLHKSQASSDDVTKTAIEINKSLTALGDVFKAIAEGKQLVPYRNHKLAQVVQGCISSSDAIREARSTKKTILIAACSPAGRDVEDTDMTLKYAIRAKFGRLKGEF